MLFSIEDSSSLLSVQPILLMLVIWTGAGLLYSDDCRVISSDRSKGWIDSRCFSGMGAGLGFWLFDLSGDECWRTRAGSL